MCLNKSQPVITSIRTKFKAVYDKTHKILRDIFVTQNENSSDSGCLLKLERCKNILCNLYAFWDTLCRNNFTNTTY